MLRTEQRIRVVGALEGLTVWSTEGQEVAHTWHSILAEPMQRRLRGSRE